MKTKILNVIFTMSLALWSCTDKTEEVWVNDNPYTPLEVTGRHIEVAHGIWDFSLEYLKSAHELNPGENVLVSPLGVAMVTGMLASAMEPAEAVDLMDVMRLGSADVNDLNNLMHTFIEKLPTIDKKTTFQTGNLLWCQGTVAEQYDGALGTYYNAEIMSNRFPPVFPDEIKAINEWSAAVTDNAIDKVFDENYTPGYTLWVNVLNFNGSWADKIDKQNTKQSTFYRRAGESGYTVDMMYYNGNKAYSWYNYHEMTDPIGFFTLPYGNGAFCFTAVLPPKNNQDLNYTLDHITYDSSNITELRNELAEFNEDTHLAQACVYLPKMAANEEIDLIPVLENMGVKSIFEGTAMPGLEEDNIEVTTFKQLLDFEVDEEGTTIKAVTFADLYGAAPADKLEFNRPFVYLVWERSTGAVLLAGIYNHP